MMFDPDPMSPIDPKVLMVVASMRVAQARHSIADAQLADPRTLPWEVYKAGSIAAYKASAACDCTHDEALKEADALFPAAVRVLLLSNGWRP
jgi:hypothetical protein